jgi:hypothetical protein
VRAGQNEIHHRVVESGWRPCHRRVALGAVRGKVCRCVIRVCCALKVFQMARDARRTGEIVSVLHVAIGALPWRNCVPTG